MEQKANDLSFDILPIKGERMIEYYKKPEGIKKIQFDETIEIDAVLSTVLNRLTERNFLFVREGSDICGLLTKADLNKREVILQIYAMLVELERALINFIRKHFGDDLSPENIGENESESSFSQAYERYLEDKKTNTEATLYEYLYLSNLFNIVRKNEKLLKGLGFSSGTAFKRNTSGINELRNCVMHPSKFLISGENEVETASKRIKQVQEFLFAINSAQHVPY